MRFSFFIKVAAVLTFAVLSAACTGQHAPVDDQQQQELPPRILAVTGQGTGAITVSADDPNGDDLTVTATPSAGITVDKPTQTITGGAGEAHFAFSSTSPMAPASGNVTISVSDGKISEPVKEPCDVIAPPASFTDDSLYAIPLQDEVETGQPITILVATGKLPNPLMFMTGVRVSAQAGWHYVADSFNVGAVGGAKTDKDGLWSALPTSYSFLLPPDSFIEASTEGGQTAYDFNITPIDGDDISSFGIDDASGALFNFQVTFDKPGTYDFGFVGTDVVLRTGYHSELQTETDNHHDWGNISNDYEGVGHTVTVTGDPIEPVYLGPGDIIPLPDYDISATLLPQSFEYGGSVDSLEVTYDNYDEATPSDWMNPDDWTDPTRRPPKLIQVTVTAKGAQDLRLAYVDLAYPADQLSIYTSAGGPALDPHLDSPMNLGLGYYGHLRFFSGSLDAKNGPGFTGDGVIALFYLSQGASYNFEREIKPPVDDAAKQPVTYDADNSKLRWAYTLPGDFNQDGTADLFDFTPLVYHFSDPVVTGDDITNVIAPGMDNVTISALQNLGIHYFNQIESFNVYSGTEAQWPDEGTLLGNVAFDAAIGDPLTTRLYFEYGLTPEAGKSYWVRPVAGSTEGISSDFVTP